MATRYAWCAKTPGDSAPEGGAAGSDSCVELGFELVDGRVRFFVAANGAGFDMQYAGNLFNPLQRLHSTDQFPGARIGLATAARIVRRHDRRIHAISAAHPGARCMFTLAPASAVRAVAPRSWLSVRRSQREPRCHEDRCQCGDALATEHQRIGCVPVTDVGIHQAQDAGGGQADQPWPPRHQDASPGSDQAVEQHHVDRFAGLDAALVMSQHDETIGLAHRAQDARTLGAGDAHH